MSALDQLKQAIVKIPRPSWGTGYLVAPDRVATCYHVIQDWNGDEHEVEIGYANPVSRRARVLVANEQTDCAVLTLNEAVEFAPLRFGDELDCEAHWLGFGYPKSAEGVGIKLSGEVHDARNRDQTGRRVMHLFSKLIAAGAGTELHGFSGTPVLVEGCLVGHMIRHIGDTDDTRRPAYGLVFATLAGGVADLMDTDPDRCRNEPLKLADVTEFVRTIRETGVAEARRADTPEALTVLAARTLIGRNRPGLAYELLSAAPFRGVVARQQRALALSKTGRIEELIAELQSLLAEGARDPETVGILAGRYKSLWAKRGDRAALQESHRLYAEGFEEHENSYNGINAAATALYLGNRAKSVLLAHRTLAAIDLEGDLDHWQLATVGEAWLLQEEYDQAAKWYGRAVARERELYQDIAVMRRQARATLRRLGQPEGRLDDVLEVPRVIVFGGHMIDAPGREPPRFPPEQMDRVKREIRKELDRAGPAQGFGLAARGSDILILEELIRRGVKPIVIMPFPEPEFRRISVSDWGERLDAIRDRLEVRILSQDAPTEDQINEAFAASNLEVKRLALEHARRLDDKPILIVVWDGRDTGDGPGGTADLVKVWREERIEPIVIDPRPNG